MTSLLNHSKITSLYPLSISFALFSSMFYIALFSCIFLLLISTILTLNTSLKESDFSKILACFKSLLSVS
jgi:hypothetical protein